MLPVTGYPGNVVPGASFIRGQRLQGALLDWARQRDVDALEAVIGSAVSVGNAWPLPASVEAESVSPPERRPDRPRSASAAAGAGGLEHWDVAPVPLSLYEKKKTARDPRWPDWASRSGCADVPGGEDTLDQLRFDPARSSEWKRPKDRTFVFRRGPGQPWERFRPALDYHLRNRVPARRGGAGDTVDREAALFATEEIAEDTRFLVDIHFAADAAARTFADRFAPLLDGSSWLCLGRGRRPVRVEAFRWLEPPEVGAAGAGSGGAGAADTVRTGAGSTGAGAPFDGELSAGAPDAGSRGEGAPDAGSRSEGAPDAGSRSEGAPDAGSRSEGAPDAGSRSEGAPGGAAEGAGSSRVDRAFTLFLDSDLIVRGPRLGFLEVLDREALEALLEDDAVEVPDTVRVESRFTDVEEVRGFNWVSGLPRPAATALRRGSIVRVSGAGCGRIRAALEERLRQGRWLGERTGAGFGRFRLDFDPLGDSSIARASSGGTEAVEAGARGGRARSGDAEAVETGARGGEGGLADEEAVETGARGGEGGLADEEAVETGARGDEARRTDRWALTPEEARISATERLHEAARLAVAALRIDGARLTRTQWQFLRQQALLLAGEEASGAVLAGAGTAALAGAGTAALAGAGTAAHPGAGTAAEPGAGTAAEPGAGTAAEPGAGTAAHPGAETSAHPGAETAAHSGAGTAAHPAGPLFDALLAHAKKPAGRAWRPSDLETLRAATVRASKCAARPREAAGRFLELVARYGLLELRDR
jgi:hypothetical protein